MNSGFSIPTHPSAGTNNEERKTAAVASTENSNSLHSTDYGVSDWQNLSRAVADYTDEKMDMEALWQEAMADFGEATQVFQGIEFSDDSELQFAYQDRQDKNSNTPLVTHDKANLNSQQARKQDSPVQGFQQKLPAPQEDLQNCGIPVNKDVCEVFHVFRTNASPMFDAQDGPMHSSSIAATNHDGVTRTNPAIVHHDPTSPACQYWEQTNFTPPIPLIQWIGLEKTRPSHDFKASVMRKLYVTYGICKLLQFSPNQVQEVNCKNFAIIESLHDYGGRSLVLKC